MGGKGAPPSLPFHPCTNGASGGAGLHLEGVAPSAATLACGFVGGLGGAAGDVGCSTGPTGSGLEVVNGTHTALSGATHSFSSSSPVRVGQLQSKLYTGAPGELVFADFSATQGFFYSPPYLGVLTLGNPFFVFFEGVIPASGQLAKTFGVQPIGAIEGAVGYLQAGFYDPSGGQISQGAPSSLVLLSPGL